jgi:hypothetical protein
MASSTDHETSNKPPVLESRASFDDWKVDFEDWCRGRGLWTPIFESDDALRRASTRRQQAFAALCQAVKKDALIHKGDKFNEWRKMSDPPPELAFEYVKQVCQPSSIDAIMRVEIEVNTFKILPGENVEEFIRRFNDLHARLPKPLEDGVRVRHLMRAMNENKRIYSQYELEMRNMLSRNSKVKYETFIAGILRRMENLRYEALNSRQDSLEEVNHVNQNQGRSNQDNQRGRGRGNYQARGRGRGRNQHRRGRGRGNYHGKNYNPNHYQPRSQNSHHSPNNPTNQQPRYPGQTLPSCFQECANFLQYCQNLSLPQPSSQPLPQPSPQTNPHLQPCSTGPIGNQVDGHINKRQRMESSNLVCEKELVIFSKNEPFLIDSGCSNHMCGNLDMFDSYELIAEEKKLVELANGKLLK